MNRLSQFFGIDEDSEHVLRQPQSIGPLREPSQVRFNVAARSTETAFGSNRYYVHQGWWLCDFPVIVLELHSHPSSLTMHPKLLQ